ncbi:MAG: hypothetical protein LWX11_01615 [Firmicutes bacterium]|nr:hypothetical protein [Bacillota bacterium]
MKFAPIALVLCASFALVAQPKPAAPKPAPAPAAPTTPAKPAPQPLPTATGIVGNKDSKVYHNANCRLASKMKPEHKTTFASKAEAEKAGYKACKVCKP